MSTSTFSTLWTCQNYTFNNSSFSGGNGVMLDVDSAGDIYFAGWFENAGNIGSNSFPSTIYTLGKFDSNASTLWISTSALTTTGLPGGPPLFTIASAPDNTLVVGTEYFYVPFPGETAIGATDVVLQKLAPTGEVMWTSETTINGSNNGIGTGSNFNTVFKVGSDSNIYGAHATNGTILGGTYTGAVNTDFDVALWSLNSNGVKNWAYQLSTFIQPGSNMPTGMVLDNSNNIYLTGATNGIYFVSKYNSNGTQIWQNISSINTGENFFIYGQIQPAIDGLSNVYVTYYTSSNLPTTSNVGGIDVLVIQLNNNGVFQWGVQMPTLNTPSQDSFPSIVGLPGGGVIVANKYVPFNSLTSVTRINANGSIYATTTNSDFNSSDCAPAVFGESRALAYYDNSVILYQQLFNGTALPGKTSTSGSKDIGFVKLGLFETAPLPPSIEIRPRCSNASITYYYTGNGTGAAPSSYRLVYNGPAPTASTITAPTWGYTATGLTDGAYYSSFVTAITPAGESQPSYFRTVQPNGFPDPPTNVRAAVNAPASSVRFDWNFPAAPQTAKIGWYVVTDSNNTALRSNTTAQYSTINFNIYPGYNHVYYLQSVNDPGYSVRAFNSSITIPYTFAYYPFENSINDAYNVYNMNSNGSLAYNNVTYYIGTESLEFDGTTAYTSFNNGFPNINYWPGFTWMGWVNLTDNTNFRTLFDIGQNTDTYLISHLFNNKMYLGIASNQFSGGYATNVEGPDVNLNTWDHYVFTLGHGTMKMYRNGAYQVEAATSGLGISNLAPSTGYFGKSFAAYPYLQGYLDDVGMFNWDLNQNQISYIYNTQASSQASLSSLISTVTGLA
jgi:hypothetical protein